MKNWISVTLFSVKVFNDWNQTTLALNAFKTDVWEHVKNLAGNMGRQRFLWPTQITILILLFDAFRVLV